MTENPNQPTQYDAVQGGQAPPPSSGVILGGIEGVKRRLASPVARARIAALSEALNYGEAGLNLVLQILTFESGQLQQAAQSLLFQKRAEPRVKQRLLECNPWLIFECLFTLEGHSDAVNSITISPEGKTLVSCGNDAAIKLWDLQRERLLRTIKQHDSYWAYCSPDGKALVSSSSDHRIKVWDGQTKQILCTLSGHSGSICYVAISPDRKTLVTGGYDTIVDNTYYITIKVWNLQTEQLLCTLKELSSTIRAIAISSDRNTLFCGNSDNTIEVWNLQTGQLLRTLEGHEGWVRCVVLSQDGKTLVSSSMYTIKVWNWKTGQLLRTLKGRPEVVFSLAISPDGKTIFSSSGNNTIKVWNWRTEQLLYTLEGRSSRLHCISPDEKTIFSTSDDGVIQVLDMQMGQTLRTLEGHSNRIFSLAISSDGLTLISGSEDKTIRYGIGRQGSFSVLWKGILAVRSQGIQLTRFLLFLSARMGKF